MNRVLLRKWLFLLVMLVPMYTFAQQITLKGKVISQDDGLAIPGATVKVKGTTEGALAGSDGSFSLKADRGATLVVSFIGYLSKEVKVTGNTVIINLSSQTRALAEVTVTTAQGIKRQARSIGYSVATIDNKTLNEGKPVDVANGLTAKVSGLQVNLVSNGINPSTRIVLRGARSIKGNNQALVVVDDVITNSDILATLNPNDIESTTILKGANASALYGADGANGVIIVTTKKGTNGQPLINYSFTGQVEELSYLPPQNTQFGSYGGEAAGSINGVTGSAGQYPSTDRNGFYLYQPYENQSFGPLYNGKLVPLGGPVQIHHPDGSTTIDTLKVPYSYHGKGVRDWFNKAYTIQHDFSFSNGNKDNGFYFSVQDVNKTGIVPNEKYERTGFRVNGTNKKGIFFINYNANYSRISTQEVGGSFFQGRPYYFNAFQTPGQVPVNLEKNIDGPYGDVNGFYSSYAPNPAWQSNHSFIRNKDDRFLGGVSIGIKPTDWLTLTARTGITYDGYSVKQTRDAVNFSTFALTDPTGTSNMASQLKFVQAASGTNVSQGVVAGNITQISADFLANFKKKFNDFTVDLTLGATTKDNTSKFATLTANSLVIPNFFNISNVQGVPGYAEYNSQRRLIGAFGDLTVGYKNWLFLNVTGRKDYTSLLSIANRSYFYPQANLGFVFTDALPFLKDNKILTYGKLSGSISKVYQVSIPEYSLRNFYVLGAGFPFGSQAGYGQSSSTLDPNLKPEQTLAKEIDIELGFLDNRINFKAAYYKENTKDQTLPVDISAATGFTSAQINTGELENHGYEFDLNFAPVVSLNNGFRWDFGANLSIVQNKVISLYKGLKEIAILNTLNSSFSGKADIYAIVGSPYPILKTPDFLRDKMGRVIVDGSTGLPSVDPVLKNVGQTNPKYRLGLNTSFSFKGLRLSVVADYRAGNVILNGIGQSLDFGGTDAHSTQNGRQRFVWPNSVLLNADGTSSPNKNVTVNDGGYTLYSGFLNSAGAAGTPYVTSAAFWKLRELSLSYTIPQRWLDQTKFIKKASIGLVGRNLLMWRPKSNTFTDPEFSEDNSNATGYTTVNQTPPTRLYGITASISF